MLRWTIEQIILELKYTWKISRNASDVKTNLVVTVSDDHHRGAGEAAPNVRYNETPTELISQFNTFLASVPEGLDSLPELADCFKRIKVSNALRFAIESALVHYLCVRDKKTVAEFFEIPPVKQVQTSYSIPIMPVGELKEFYTRHQLGRFPFIKLKIDKDSGQDAIGYAGRFCDQPLIVDANEAFDDVEGCIYFFENIKKSNIEFIEQPMPALRVEESFYLKKYSPFKLVADESITGDADFSMLKKMFDGVNIKLMKAGGYENSIRLLNEAKKQNMLAMIGCMVETTLGISSAMNLCSLVDYADLDSFLLIKNESYHLVEEMNGQLRLTTPR